MSVVLEHVERIAAPADLVWPFFRWDNLEAMRAGGFFITVEYRERRATPGAVRVVTLSDGARLVERLEYQDAANRHLAYAMVETPGVPVTDYRGSVTVSPSDDGSCLVRFRCECTPVGLSAESWRDAWTAMQVANAAFIRAAATTARRPG
jgi:hypothetical protein